MVSGAWSHAAGCHCVKQTSFLVVTVASKSSSVENTPERILCDLAQKEFLGHAGSVSAWPFSFLACKFALFWRIVMGDDVTSRMVRDALERVIGRYLADTELNHISSHAQKAMPLIHGALKDLGVSWVQLASGHCLMRYRGRQAVGANIFAPITRLLPKVQKQCFR